MENYLDVIPIALDKFMSELDRVKIKNTIS